MSERSSGSLARLTLRQFNRLRYIAACGPVFRIEDDEDLERLQLVRPFNGMPTVVEVEPILRDATVRETKNDDPQDTHLSTDSLLDACRTTLAEFTQRDWCRVGYGCEDCEGCQRYRRLEFAVARAEQRDAQSSAPSPEPIVACRTA
ncbi:MAG: hypothetical protein RIC55_29945 [Pirellulaceae bacterium]